MIDVFKAVKAHLKANVPGLKMLERWNNQLATEGAETVLLFPAIYYQIDGVKTTTRTKGVQDCEGILRIRHCDKQLKAGLLNTYDYEQASYLALQNWKGGPIMTGLDRIALYPDPNHAAVEVVISEYRLKYTDSSKLEAAVVMVSPEQAGITGETAVDEA